jgi:hypothetical protein
MAATLTKKCSSCGEQHELFLPGPEDMAHAKTNYQYTCPKNNKRIQLSLGYADFWKTVLTRPAGSVVVEVSSA